MEAKLAVKSIYTKNYSVELYETETGEYLIAYEDYGTKSSNIYENIKDFTQANYLFNHIQQTLERH